jgi:hypothetical protein
MPNCLNPFGLGRSIACKANGCRLGKQEWPFRNREKRRVVEYGFGMIPNRPMGAETREMTPSERTLVRWMLDHGKPEATGYRDQLEVAQVTAWKCGCGCASFNLSIPGRPAPPPGVHVLADFVIEEREDGYSGIFVYESGGILSGVEVTGVPNAPRTLPRPEQLRPFEQKAEQSSAGDIATRTATEK